MADRHLGEAHELATAIGDRSILTIIELHIAKLRIRQGGLAGARASCHCTRGILDKIGDAREAGEAECVEGVVARAGGDAVVAEQHFLQAEQIGIARQDCVTDAFDALTSLALIA